MFQASQLWLIYLADRKSRKNLSRLLLINHDLVCQNSGSKWCVVCYTAGQVTIRVNINTSAGLILMDIRVCCLWYRLVEGSFVYVHALH